jgi:spermidine dehydrogenase
MGPKVFFDQETFGADKLAVDPHQYRSTMPSEQKDRLWKQFAAQSALPEQGNADVKRLYESEEDFLPGLSSAEKKAKLAKVSYSDFLTDSVKVDPSVVQFMSNRMIDPYGVGADAIPAQDAWGMGMPGFAGMKLDPVPGPGMGRNAMGPQDGETQYFHFPDGNASLARLLVRKLLPDAVPGSTADDVVMARVHYDLLDQPKNDVRIRLNSSVVRAKHLGEVSSAKEVEVAYVQKGKLFTVRAGHCILACWNTVIPFITPEISPEQKSALTATDKLPMVYTNVALKNWSSFIKLGAGSIYAPSSYWSSVALDERVSMGGYEATKKPDEPILVTMRHFPCSPGLPARSQHRAGRAELYGTSFDTMERSARDQLTHTLAGADFDPARDIAAITVNRWGHGRTYQYNSLWDALWMDGKALPCEKARRPFGRVAIANSDSDAYGWADAAINQGFRAVDDLQLKPAGA